MGDVVRLVPKDNAGNKEKLGDISRERFLGFLTSYTSLTTKVSSVDTTSNIFSLDLTYGWNHESFEYGPILQYGFNRQSLTDQSTLEIGGLIDYNFSKNIVQNEWVSGLRLTAAVGQQDNSAQKSAANTSRIEPAFVVKWFGLSTNLAAVGSLSYRMMTVSLDSGSTTISGLAAQIGIQTYF